MFHNLYNVEEFGKGCIRNMEYWHWWADKAETFQHPNFDETWEESVLCLVFPLNIESQPEMKIWSMLSVLCLWDDPWRHVHRSNVSGKLGSLWTQSVLNNNCCISDAWKIESLNTKRKEWGVEEYAVIWCLWGVLAVCCSSLASTHPQFALLVLLIAMFSCIFWALGLWLSKTFNSI